MGEPAEDAPSPATSAQPYQRDSLIDAGGRGVVYRARGRSGEPVAVKEFDGAYPELLSRFTRIRHPNLLPILDLGTLRGEVSERHFIVMPLVVETPDPGDAAPVVPVAGDDEALAPLYGTTLDASLRAASPLTVEQVASFASQCARGLSALHGARMVHGNIHPGTVFLLRDYTVRIAGIGPRHDPTTQDSRYVAPELFEGQPPSPLSDQYSLAACCRDALNHGADFSAAPAEFRRVLARALAANPRHRFPSVVDFANALQRAAAPAAALLPAPGSRDVEEPEDESGSPFLTRGTALAARGVLITGATAAVMFLGVMLVARIMGSLDSRGSVAGVDHVVVRSSEPTAAIYIDGRQCGFGECDSVIQPGSHKAEARALGFRPDSTVFAVQRGAATAPIVLQPAPIPPRIRIATSSDDTELRIDGKPSLVTAAQPFESTRVDAGTHAVRAWSGQSSISFSLVHHPARSPDVDTGGHRLNAEAVFVSGIAGRVRIVATNPATRILLDGQRLGVTTDAGIPTPELTPGEHSISAEIPRAPVQRFTFEVGEGPFLVASLVFGVPPEAPVR